MARRAVYPTFTRRAPGRRAVRASALHLAPGVLRRWLATTPLEEFTSRYLQRSPFARPGSAGDAKRVDWALLGRLLPRANDVLVVRRGELLDTPRPRTLVELVEGFRVGTGIVVRGAEQLAPELAALCADFAEILGPSLIQLFATAGDTPGFGWHFDDEDVFIAQTAGVKDYYLRENTVVAGAAAAAAFACYRDERSPLQQVTLCPGDFLYIPARWWHVAEPREHSLSISVGVRPERVGTGLAPARVRFDTRSLR